VIEKNNLIKGYAKEFGYCIDDLVGSDEYLNILKMILTEQNISPEGTTIEWVGRVLNEMYLGNQRIILHEPKKGNFDIVYFSAVSEDTTPDLLKKKRAWRGFCKKITFIPIQEKHSKILEPAPSKLIAEMVDLFFSESFVN
ncbi:MAG: hypothetical protein ACKOEW_04430, partial [Methylocystis sp.]